MLTRRSRNSYIRDLRRVTRHPTGCPARTLKEAIDFFARRIAAFCPAIRESSLTAESSSLMFSVASPTPIFNMIFRMRGIAQMFSNWRSFFRVVPKEGKAFVESVHFVKRHTRANPGKNIKGGIVEREAPIHVSKLKVICPECSEPVRIGYSRLEDGRKVRLCRKCQGIIDRN